LWGAFAQARSKTVEASVTESIAVAPYPPIQLPKDPAERQEELEKYVTASVEMLAGELSQGFSANFVKLLAFYARFHKYSSLNTLLIMLQRPEASKVASYKKWQELGRQVAKGSKAIYIYAPLLKREKDAVTGDPAEKILGFRLVAVFADLDLDNIENEPLPQLWHPLPDDCSRQLGRAIERIRASGISVTERKLKAGLQGMATATAITLSSSIPDSRNRLATLLHEAAHSYCHYGETAKDKTTAQCELESEAAAWVVMRQIGLDYPFSSDYLKAFGIKPDDLRASLTVIGGISKRLLKLLDDDQAQPEAA